MQKQTFGEPYKTRALYEPTLKATEEIRGKLEWQTATTVIENTKPPQTQILSIYLVALSYSGLFRILDFNGNTESLQQSLNLLSLSVTH